MDYIQTRRPKSKSEERWNYSLRLLSRELKKSISIKDLEDRISALEEQLEELNRKEE